MYQHPADVGLVPVGDHGKIASPRGDVLFFHGLTGHAFKTWQHPGTDFQWPEQLAAAAPDVRVWAVHYPAELVRALAYLASAQESTQDIAVRLAQCIWDRRTCALLTEKGPPCVFICHSLGGLLAKRLLLHAHRIEAEEALDERAFCSDRVQGILFLGTPHRGSNLATMGGHVESALKEGGKALTALLSVFDSAAVLLGKAVSVGPATTVLAEELKRGNDQLQHLHQDFTRLYQARWEAGKPLHVMAGVELRSPVGYPDLLVVDEGSADPRMARVLHATPVPPLRINRTHSEICKPSSASDEIFQWGLSLLARVRDGSDHYGSPPVDEAQALVWRVKWALHTALRSNLRLRRAWQDTLSDADLADGHRLDERVAARVNEWVGDADAGCLSDAITALARLLTSLREAGAAQGADAKMLVDGVRQIVGLLCVALVCPRLDSDPIRQTTWRARTPAAQMLLNEMVAAAHKGRPAHLGLDPGTREFDAGRDHWLSSDLCQDLRPEQLVPSIELAMYNHNEAGGEGPISLKSLRQGPALSVDADVRSQLRPIARHLLTKGRGPVIDNAQQPCIPWENVGLMEQLLASPVAIVVTVLEFPQCDDAVDADRFGQMSGALKVFRNELRQWPDAATR